MLTAAELPPIEFAVALEFSNGTREVTDRYSWKTVVEVAKTGHFDRPSQIYQRRSSVEVLLCAIGIESAQTIQPAWSLRKLIAGIANQYARPSSVHFALLHSCVMQCLTNSRVNTDAFVSRDGKVFVDSPTRGLSGSVERNFEFEGPDWYVDLGGSRTCAQLGDWLNAYRKGAAFEPPVVRSSNDDAAAAAELERMRAALEEI